MAGNLLQVGPDHKIRVSDVGLKVGGAADACCCACATTFTCPHCSSGKIGAPVTATIDDVVYDFANTFATTTCYDCGTGRSYSTFPNRSNSSLPVFLLDGATVTGTFANLDTSTAGVNLTSQSCYAQIGLGTNYNLNVGRVNAANCASGGGGTSTSGQSLVIMRVAGGYRVWIGASASTGIAFYGEVSSAACGKGTTLTVNNVFAAGDVGCHTTTIPSYPFSSTVIASANPHYLIYAYGGSVTFTICP